MVFYRFLLGLIPSCLLASGAIFEMISRNPGGFGDLLDNHYQRPNQGAPKPTVAPLREIFAYQNLPKEW